MIVCSDLSHVSLKDGLKGLPLFCLSQSFPRTEAIPFGGICQKYLKANKLVTVLRGKGEQQVVTRITVKQTKKPGWKRSLNIRYLRGKGLFKVLPQIRDSWESVCMLGSRHMFWKDLKLSPLTNLWAPCKQEVKVKGKAVNSLAILMLKDYPQQSICKN